MGLFPTRFAGRLAATAMVCAIAPAMLSAQSLSPLTKAAAEITGQPSDKVICIGDTVSFTVNARATSASQKLKFQWIDLEGNILQDGPSSTGSILEGTQTSTLTIRDARTDDGGIGKYAVIIDVDPSDLTQYTPTTSRNVNLTVVNKTTIDDPLDDITICSGTPVTLKAGATGIELNYFWYKDGQLITNGNSNTFISDTANYGGRYKLVVRGRCGDDSTEAVVTENRAPEVTAITPSGPIYVGRGSTLSIAVTATGTGLNYQWYKDGTPIPGATSATLSLPVGNEQEAIGNYYVNISNECGSGTLSSSVQVITGVDDIVDNGYKLSLSTPNPVINNSMISFNVPAPQHARLVVTDVTGNQVAVLFDAVAAGTTSVRFDSASLAPGVYFYTLTAGGFRATQSMSVVK